MDIAKGMLDFGIHPPTVYFPLNVKEAFMIEPTETESKETIDNVVAIYRKLYDLAKTNPDALKEAPVTLPVRRIDEVGADRNPILKYHFPD
jgi:glycine dehydrogenase subunit 2